MSLAAVDEMHISFWNLEHVADVACSMAEPFATEDWMFPVFCTDCRKQVTRKESRAGNGLCGRCLRRFLDSPTADMPAKRFIPLWQERLRIYGLSKTMRSMILCSVCTTALFWPSHGMVKAALIAEAAPEIPKAMDNFVSPPSPPAPPAFANDAESVRRRGEMYSVMQEQVYERMSVKYPDAEMSYGERSTNGPMNQKTPTAWSLRGEVFSGKEAKRWRATFIESHDGTTVNWTLEDLSNGKVEIYSFPTPSDWIW